MNRKVKLLAALLMTIVMAAAFAGCSNSGSSADDESSDTSTTSETVQQSKLSESQTTAATDTTTESTDAAEYNIASVLNEKIKSCLPTDVDYTVEQIDSTSLQIVLKSANEAGFGGVAGEIMAFTEGSNEYKDFPEYREIGTKDGKVYILLEATDVQYDTSSTQQETDYNKLVKGLETLTVQ